MGTINKIFVFTLLLQFILFFPTLGSKRKVFHVFEARKYLLVYIKFLVVKYLVDS